MQDVCKNKDKYNRVKKRKMLILFYDEIVDMISNTKRNELFIGGRTFNNSLFLLSSHDLKKHKVL